MEQNLIESVRALLARFEEHTHVAATLSVTPEWPKRLRAAAALNIFRITEEALVNVRLHSGAQLVEVALDTSAGNVAVEVRDDGKGVAAEGDAKKPGLGVMGMRERALLLGGRLEVLSADGGGTVVRAILPNEQLI